MATTVPPFDFDLSSIIFEFSFWRDDVSSCPHATKRTSCITLASDRLLARLRERLPGSRGGSLVALADLLHVVAGLGVGRHAMTKLEHRSLACVVTRQHEIDAVVEPVEQFAQVACSTRDVLGWVVRPSHAEARSGPRHQLQQSGGPLR